ncbi:peptide ABC transporter ATP-binding protein [Candidatus Nitromaritima sp. SCGC AAA799-A02]|nr:peptide ABC transporter ATP-binding protein [Candidatus Nitromaritima sp. SCGC AAA799-A02]KMP11897.1 peptide ABC transporter ATP-binding protein [Candidatus Nitromaritima sp. SCGC AAA799-C22]
MPTPSPLLNIENLSTSFYTDVGMVKAVREINLRIDAGETLALVGESGCGKSVTALSALRLLPMPPAHFDSGSIRFNGSDLLSLSEREMQDIRGNDISMIFQEPMTSLNPIFTVGDQVSEAIVLHRKKSAAEARDLTLDLLRKVAISSPEQRVDQYPHELSGGMKQRVMIAMAIACRPALLIADEPTTALDVTIQAQILNLLVSLREETGMAILLITHNLGIVAQFADRVAVMYSGKVVEEAPVEALFESPMHPYTRGLLNSLPSGDGDKKLESIPGAVPHPIHLPQGCAFHPRCGDVMPRCREEVPPETDIPATPGHSTACWLYGDLSKESA